MYVPPQKVWFFSCFGLKIGHSFYHFGLKLGMVLLSGLKLGTDFKRTTSASLFIGLYIFSRLKRKKDKSFDMIKRDLPGLKTARGLKKGMFFFTYFGLKSSQGLEMNRVAGGGGGTP